MTIEGKLLADESLLDAVAKEIEEAAPATFGFRPLSVLQLTSIMQLTLRLSSVPEPHRVLCAAVVAMATQYFSDQGCVDTVRVIEAGNDPANDEPAGTVQ